MAFLFRLRLGARPSLLFAVVLAPWLALLTASASAQGFPPPALETATSVEAAFTALGAGKPPTTTRLLLDLPDITVPGRVHVRLGSELPGTAAFVLLRGETAAPPTPGTPPPPPAPAAAQGKPMPVLIKAHKFPAGEAATLEFDFDIEGPTQSYTLLAYVQGRWLSTTRQVKVGKAPSTAAAAKKR